MVLGGPNEIIMPWKITVCNYNNPGGGAEIHPMLGNTYCSISAMATES